MSMAEDYLYERREMLSGEKVKLITEINEIDLEREETEDKIRELEQSIDDSFEVFSPRTRKNDFVRNEIISFKERLEELLLIKKQKIEHLELVDNDLQMINEALGDRDDEEDFSYERQDEFYDNSISGISIIENQECINSIEAEKLLGTVNQALTNLVHKCEICSKVMEVDILRARLELEVMSDILKNTIKEVESIAYDIAPLSIGGSRENIIAEVIKSENQNDKADISFDIEGDINEIDEVEFITAVKILREVIRNSAGYFKGENISVLINCQEDTLQIIISDDESELYQNDEEDFDIISETDSEKQFEFKLLYDKVYLLNGSIDIDVQPEGGRLVNILLPIVKICKDD